MKKSVLCNGWKGMRRGPSGGAQGDGRQRGGVAAMNTGLKKIVLAAMMVALMGISTKAMAGAAAPTITAIEPNIGTASAVATGEVIEIKGTNFNNGNVTSVKFGTTAAAFVIVGGNVLSVTVPAHVRGLVDVTVDNGTAPAAVAVKGFTYTTPNRVLQVAVNMTLGKNASIAWDIATTSADDALNAVGGGAAHNTVPTSVTSFNWYPYDGEFGVPAAGNPAQIDLGGTYSTDGTGASGLTKDTDNGKHLDVVAVSGTGNTIKIDGIASDSVPGGGGVTGWINGNGGAPALDTFRVSGHIVGAGTAGVQVLKNNAATNLIDTVATGTTVNFYLQVETPTGSTDAAGTTQVATVSLVASAD
jgi:hypothetical protein